jgi:hypothetical protein
MVDAMRSASGGPERSRSATPSARSGLVKDRHVTGLHLTDQYPDLVIRPIVEQFGGIWSDDQPVVVDENLMSSRNPMISCI